jgi:hypothetical protein
MVVRRHHPYRIGNVYASVCSCVVEATVKFCQPRTISRQQLRESYTHGVDMSDVVKNDGAYTEEQLKQFREWREPRRGGHSDGKVSLEAVRLKKSRLFKTAKTIVGLHGDRTRFITITVKENVMEKKQFLYMLENLRKKLQAAGYCIKYSGMIERQERGAWHLHALAYRLGGAEWKRGEKDWNFRAMNGIAKKMGMNMDIRELEKSRRASKKIASYMAKLEAVVVAAYAVKSQTGEDYCYTLTSKGCDLPKRFKIYDPKAAMYFIEGYGFRQVSHDKDGKTFFHYLLESEAFSREIYDTC